MVSRIYRLFFLFFFGLILFAVPRTLSAETATTPAGSFYQEGTDSADVSDIVPQTEILDSAYLDKDIFSLLSRRNFENGSVVNLKCSNHIEGKLEYYKKNAANRPIRGFRVRIFFDNRQDARTRSEEIESSFSEEHPGLGVYRSYENPYFKVTVGDLRTRSEAEKLLRELEKDYPSAFIVREEINFPPLGY
jgi:hypothetical protein